MFGTVIAYCIEKGIVKSIKDNNLLAKDKKVIGKIVTTTSLSDTAKLFAKLLAIKHDENVSMVYYPMVKCNISKKTKEKNIPFTF